MKNMGNDRRNSNKQRKPEDNANHGKDRIECTAHNTNTEPNDGPPKSRHSLKRKGQAAPYEQHAGKEQMGSVTEPGPIIRQQLGRIVGISDKSKMGTLRHDHSPFLALVRTALVAGAAGVSA